MRTVLARDNTSERKRGAAERHPIGNFYTPMGGLISVAYMIYGLTNFCQYLSVERHLNDDNSGVPVQ